VIFGEKIVHLFVFYFLSSLQCFEEHFPFLALRASPAAEASGKPKPKIQIFGFFGLNFVSSRGAK
jgi:hypothetical protein